MVDLATTRSDDLEYHSRCRALPPQELRLLLHRVLNSYSAVDIPEMVNGWKYEGSSLDLKLVITAVAKGLVIVVANGNSISRWISQSLSTRVSGNEVDSGLSTLYAIRAGVMELVSAGSPTQNVAQNRPVRLEKSLGLRYGGPNS
ncbi:unnamed protein product [Calypogeia fissa]